MRLNVTLLTLAGMVPTIMAAQAYVPIGWAPDNALIHNKPVNANDGRFFIGKETTAVPSYGQNPDRYNTTIISGPTEDDRFWMGITGVGDQTLFLGIYSPFLEYAKWALGSTTVNGKNVEGGFLPSYGTGSLQFKLSETSDGQVKLVNIGTYGGARDTPSTNGWSACVVDDFYSVEAGKVINSGLTCYDFEMGLKPTDAAAPEYYHYWDEI